MRVQPTFVASASRPAGSQARPAGVAPLKLNLNIGKLRLAGMARHERYAFQRSLHAELLRLASGPDGGRLRAVSGQVAAKHGAVQGGRVALNTTAVRLGTLAAQAIFQKIAGGRCDA